MPLGPIFTTTGKTKFRIFGTLKRVEVDDWGVHIYNEADQRVSMKKVYAFWAGVAQKALSAIDKTVIIETGHTSSANDYFRDIYVDTSLLMIGNTGILDFPEDAGENARTELVWSRTMREELGYRLRVIQDKNNELVEEMQELTVAQRGEADMASAALDKQWDELIAEPKRRFMLVGAAYLNRGKPEKPDKSFAIRLGIDTMKKKRINVEVLERTYKNNILVSLPDYGDTRCQIAIKQGNQQNTKNEWCIATVSNTLKGWQPIEDDMYPNWRSTRKDVGYYINAYNEMVNRLFSPVTSFDDL